MSDPRTKRLSELTDFDIRCMSRYELLNRLNHLNPQGEYRLNNDKERLRKVLKQWRNFARQYEP